jgi:hypothetical protein
MGSPEHEAALRDAVNKAQGHAAETTRTLAECVDTFQRWLHLPDPGALYATLAAVAANRGEGDAVWLLIVGAPGAGKTETIAPLAALPDCYPAATLTEASLLSGVPKREHADGAKGGLLREIGDFGIVVLKDFGSILSMNRDGRAAVLAALREIYDGSWTRHVGTSGGRALHWEGKVGLIAGCTPTIDSHHAVMGTMGERFALYRLPPGDGGEQVRRALSRGNRDASMRSELADAVRQVLDLAGAAHAHELDPAAVDRLVALAEIAARCRSAIERDGYSRDIELIPEAEAPARIALVLRRLLDGLDAIGCPPSERWRLVVKVALDSMPAIRLATLIYLVDQAKPMTAKETAEGLGYPTTTARRAMEDLAAHGAVRRAGDGKADLWRPSDWLTARWWATGTVPETSETP